MEINNPKKKTLIFIIALVLVLGLIGASYAFFTANLGGVETSETINLGGGTMTIDYYGGNNIEFSGVIPSNEPIISKTFTVTGTNTTVDLAMPYTVSLIVDDNTFSDDVITYTLISANTNGNGTIVPAIDNQISVTAGSDRYVLGEGTFYNGTDKTHTYTLNIFFPETGADQNAEQGKGFKAHIEIS